MNRDEASGFLSRLLALMIRRRGSDLLFTSAFSVSVGRQAREGVK